LELRRGYHFCFRIEKKRKIWRELPMMKIDVGAENKKSEVEDQELCSDTTWR